jgi:LysM repeat protein
MPCYPVKVSVLSMPVPAYTNEEVKLMDRAHPLWPFLVVVSLTAIASLSPPAIPAAAAAPRLQEPRLSIASPSAGTLVGGLIQVVAAFDAGRFGKVTALELWVDDLFYSGSPLEAVQARGTYTLDLDTQRLRNGQHTLKIRSLAGRRVIAADQAVVTVSNGGVDIVPPLVSFYAPLDGETVSGVTSIGVNASDNDEVALVSIAVNHMPVLIKSNPPYSYSLDTTTLPLQNGKGMITLEAMAIDRANNIGKAKPIHIFVNNPANATPMQSDPAAVPAGASRPSGQVRTRTPGLAPTPAHPRASQRTPPAAPKPQGAPRGAPAPAPSAGARMAALPPTATGSGLGANRWPSAARVTPTPTLPSPSTRATAPKATARRSATPATATRTLARPVTTAKLPQMQPADLNATPAGVTSAPSPAGARVATPRAVRPGHPVLRIPAGPVGAPTPQSSAEPTLPLLMARASLPPSGLAERGTPIAATETHAVPPREPARSTDGAAPTRLSETRATLPEAARRVPPPVTTPMASLPPAPRATASPLASLPRPTAAGAPALGPGRVTLPVFVARPVPDSPERHRVYQVKRGDRLPEIAQHYRVTPQSILVANGLVDASALRPGRKLVIPGTFDLVVDNHRIEFDVNPRFEKGLAIAPFRQIFEHAGGVVVYYPGDRTVKAARPDKEVRLQIGSREAHVNGAVVIMERAATLDSGRTLVPVRFMTEALDMVAEYDVKTGNIYLVRK